MGLKKRDVTVRELFGQAVLSAIFTVSADGSGSDSAVLRRVADWLEDNNLLLGGVGEPHLNEEDDTYSVLAYGLVV